MFILKIIFKNTESECDSAELSDLSRLIILTKDDSNETLNVSGITISELDSRYNRIESMIFSLLKTSYIT